MRSKLKAGSLAAALALALAAPAPAATLDSPHSIARDCSQQLHSEGTPGIARIAHTAAAEGMLTVDLAGGPAGDWDLAVFRGARAIGSSTAFGSDEIATVPVEAGDTVVAQGCRRDRGPASVEVEFDLYELSLDPASLPRVSLEAVSLQDEDDFERLTATGLDVTEDVNADRAIVALHSDVDRARLVSAGFDSTVHTFDLAKVDRRARATERRDRASGTRSALPSQRDTYRTYDEYTLDLKNLAEQNPGLVRPIVLATSVEGRPVQGVEIATDVNRTDDGRPVYVQMGIHHAREWPSGELTMEFGISLVQRYTQGDQRIIDLLDTTRVMIIPVSNPDGYIASNSFGFNPTTDNSQNATAALSLTGTGAYRRKNCRPLTPADGATPCAARQNGAGTDTNRNYGYYWGGGGAGTNATDQNYRGPAPNSEPETAGIHQFFSKIHPTVLITNHTVTPDGEFLRQPGAFFQGFEDLNPGPPYEPITEDEDGLKALGDTMATASNWSSVLSWNFGSPPAPGSITGATEDWNYLAQGTYGYTTEGRGPNFHGTYGNVVVNEFLGTGPAAGMGIREAFTRGGEAAMDTANHGVVSGPAPAGATLKLTKDFLTPICNGGSASQSGNACINPTPTVPEHLETTLTVPASGTYRWEVMPSSRPDVDARDEVRSPPLETWTYTCQRAGSDDVFTQQLSIGRGEFKEVDWLAADACGPEPVDPNLPPLPDFSFAPVTPVTDQTVTFTSSSTDPDGAIALTEWDLDDDGSFDDATGLVATTSFPTAGDHDVSVKVTDDDGDSAETTKTVTVGVPVPNLAPVASFGFLPADPFVDDLVNFRSTSTDSDGTIVKTEWDLDDDGNFDDALGQEITTSFGAPGTYPVTVQVTDDDGATGVAAKDVVVRAEPVPPVAKCFGSEVTLLGSTGDDILKGTSGPDVIAGRGGNDTILGFGGDDVICGEAGNDTIWAGKGNDRVLGNKGRDRLFGMAGADVLRGNRQRDRVFGGAGRDELNGGFGFDLVDGGPQRDACRGGGPGRDRLKRCP